jgi:hypothetical protein
VVLLLAALIAGFALVPPVRGHETLTPTFLWAAALLGAWAAILWAARARRGHGFAIELVRPLPVHYVQGCVQLSVYAYWGLYWPQVYAHMPLILAQLVFLLAFEALLSWSRGRAWRVGFGPLPVVLSTNLFLWFRDDWFYLQFLMVATCALGKEFLRWQRGGKSTHIFNPSAFGLAVFSLALILWGRTTELTWGVEIASTLGLSPYIYVWIFGVGLVVQYLFSVTLMTLAAVAALVLLNLGYTGVTGVYQFVDTNIPAAVFLGLHLLMTDPATSPRTNVGRVLFGAAYGTGSFVFYTLLRDLGAPEFYDKLLTVPLLNLSVQLIDRVARAGWLGRLEEWQARFVPRRVNLAHMACWAGLFAALLSTGFVQGPHPGSSIEFWRTAARGERPHATENLLKLLHSAAASGSAGALNVLGELYREGELVPRDEQLSTSYFAQASELGSLSASANLAAQFLAVEGARAGPVVERALERLEQRTQRRGQPQHLMLLAMAYETGRGRPWDPLRARELYERACQRGDNGGCAGAVRVASSGSSRP